MRSRTITPRRWNIAEPDAGVTELAHRLKTSPLIAQMLVNRGMTEPADCQTFLRPHLKALLDPANIPGMTDASTRVARAIRDQEKIVIYGDYDVDGITAVAILWHALKLLGGDVHTYIPHRIDEGYGLNRHAIEQLCDDGAKLIITVDCGITAIDPIAAAREKNVDVIVTDHHEWKSAEAVGVRPETVDEHIDSSYELRPTPSGLRPLLPAAYAIVHPRLPGDNAAYANPNLCGSGVAFKVAWAVGQAMSGATKVPDALKAFLLEAMALAALGTIADVVPLTGENRVLAHFGLSGLKQSKLTGIQALIASAELDGKKLDSYHVGFLLAPRLNACGRMGHARLAVEMLTTATHERAAEIATYLEQQNRQRQATERQMLSSALSQVEQLQLIERGDKIIVVGAPGWHPGVIGIVASRLVDRFHRPAVVIALDEATGHGSCRSIDGFHIANALAACTHTLITHGGHEMAAGLRVKVDQFEHFRAAVVAYANQHITDDNLIAEMRIDVDAGLADITTALVTDLARLGPFGRGNPKPVLRCQSVTLTAAPRKVGKTGDHLQLFIRQNDGRAMKAIAFGAGDWCDRLKSGSVVHLAVQPHLNEYNGTTSVELQVKDLQLAE